MGPTLAGLARLGRYFKWARPEPWDFGTGRPDTVVGQAVPGPGRPVNVPRFFLNSV